MCLNLRCEKRRSASCSELSAVRETSCEVMMLLIGSFLLMIVPYFEVPLKDTGNNRISLPTERLFFQNNFQKLKFSSMDKELRRNQLAFRLQIFVVSHQLVNTTIRT